MDDVKDRVRARTAAQVLRRIDQDTAVRLGDLASATNEAIASRLEELDREWDTDRVIEVEAAFTGLVGLGLGAVVHRRFLVLPAFVGAAVLLQATTGFYPLLPLLRRLGIRTSREIARERYALKSLRGDFDSMDSVAIDGKRLREPGRAEESLASQEAAR